MYDEYTWSDYLEYLRQWADEHSSPSNMGKAPASYDEWEENEGRYAYHEMESEMAQYDIFWNNLTEETQKDLLGIWGENGNHDVIPLLTIEYQPDEVDNVYVLNGYENRKDYLQQLAEEHDVELDVVLMLADTLGPSEDFDGLVNTLEDITRYC